MRVLLETFENGICTYSKQLPLQEAVLRGIANFVVLFLFRSKEPVMVNVFDLRTGIVYLSIDFYGLK